MKRFPLWLFLTLVFIGLSAPFGYVALSQLYKHYVEISAPTIELLEVPHGVGIAPTNFRFRLTDDNSGLDEVVVRSRQRGRVKELFKRKLKGVLTFEESIAFDGAKSGFQEGSLEIEIVSFDRAFWSNRSEKTVQLRVDYRKPKVEVLTTQHNARRGGSQLVFYKVFDEEPGVSGVKIGNQIFQGFRARGLDPLFEDDSLYVAFYAVDITQIVEEKSIRVFAEDLAGNSASTDFYNKILDRAQRTVKVVLTEEYLRGTATQAYEQNTAKVAHIFDSYERDPSLRALDPMLKRFKALNDSLRGFNLHEIGERLAATPRFESYLKQFFLKQNAVSKVQFGEQLSYVYNEQEIASAISSGHELVLPQGQRDVVAVNDGIVTMAETRGVYGHVIAIDHGLGVASVYAQLGDMSVQPGEQVKRGDVIGQAGVTGLAMRPGVLFEMRVHGVPVDPMEWWDATWFNQHVIGKIDETKKSLGLQVYKPL